MDTEFYIPVDSGQVAVFPAPDGLEPGEVLLKGKFGTGFVFEYDSKTLPVASLFDDGCNGVESLAMGSDIPDYVPVFELHADNKKFIICDPCYIDDFDEPLNDAGETVYDRLCDITTQCHPIPGVVEDASGKSIFVSRSNGDGVYEGLLDKEAGRITLNFNFEPLIDMGL